MPAIICPTGCATGLPIVKFDVCSPETNLSQIGHIYLGKAIAADFTDVEDPTEWAPRVSQTSTVGNDSLRPLTVIAEKPAPASTPRKISGGRTVYPAKIHTINFTIDETTQENHDFLRALECGGNFKLWYTTIGGIGFGGNGGIQDASIKIDMVLPNGDDDLMTIQGTITWTSQFTEERYADPLA